MRNSVCGLLAVLLCGTPGQPVQAQDPSTGTTGPWPVGFALVRTVDSTRRLDTGDVRPLDIGVWYPASRARQPRLTYRDYFLAAATGKELEAFSRFLLSHGARNAELAGWLAAPMMAARDVRVAGPRFPLILIAQGNGQTVPDQAPLAEFLASHGYVVATTPSPMRITGPLTDEAQMGTRAAEQAMDLERAAEDLRRRRSDIADDLIGVVGHSFGARAGLLLLMRDSGVRALVSLDGGIGTATGRSSLEALPGFRATAVQAPILHFYEELDDFMTPDFSLLRSLTGAERWVRRAPLRHHLFTSLGAASGTHRAMRVAIGADDTTAAAYIAVVEETKGFLDAFLKHEPAARARLDGPAGRQPLGPLERLGR